MNEADLENLAVPDLWKEEIGSLKDDLWVAKSEAKENQKQAQDIARQVEGLKNTITSLEVSLQSELQQSELLKSRIDELTDDRANQASEIDRLSREVDRLKRDRNFYKEESRRLMHDNMNFKNVAAVVFEGIEILREMSSGPHGHEEVADQQLLTVPETIESEAN